MTPPQTRRAETGCLPLKRGVSRQQCRDRVSPPQKRSVETRCLPPSNEECRDMSVKTGYLPLKRGVSRQGVSPSKEECLDRVSPPQTRSVETRRTRTTTQMRKRSHVRQPLKSARSSMTPDSAGHFVLTTTLIKTV